jgi:hypothetical protein
MKSRDKALIRPFASLTRRNWIAAAGGAGLAALLAESSPAATDASGVLHVPLPLGDAPDRKPEDGLVTGFLGFGWKSFAVGEPGAPASVLKGLGEAAPAVPDGAECRLRLTNSIDVRDAFAIAVATADGQAVGTFDLRFAGLYQVQELPLSPVQAREILARGAVLRMVSGPKPVWFFAPSPGASPAPDPVQLPHVLVAASRPVRHAQFDQRLRGLVMLQGFGWQSGCVSEGILDLGESRQDAALIEAADRYLGMYFTDDGVFYENPRSQPKRNRVGGVEEPLPWATLARRNPDHPAIRLGADFLLSQLDPTPVIAKGESLTTEGNYTAAYPTAVLARVLKRDDLAAKALRHLESRRIANVHGGDIYQRANPAGQGRLRNWCRGVLLVLFGHGANAAGVGRSAGRRRLETRNPTRRRPAAEVPAGRWPVGQLPARSAGRGRHLRLGRVGCRLGPRARSGLAAHRRAARRPAHAGRSGRSPDPRRLARRRGPIQQRR